MKKIYPIIIWLVASCIVFRYAILDFALVSDAAHEFIVYSLVVETGRWQMVPHHGLLSSCLFTTYFPAMFQRVFNTDIVMTYKLFPSFIIPILPVAVYYLARKWLTPHYAFLASVFVMMQIYFLWATTFARILVALSFFSLALVVVFHEGLRFRIKVGLLVMLSLCLVTSHYGITFATLFIVGTSCILLFILKKAKSIIFPHLKVILVFIGILAVASLLWHGLIAKEPLRVGLWVAEETVSPENYTGSLPTHNVPGDYPEVEKGATYGFFDLESREPVIQVAFGKTLPYMNIPQKIEFSFSWLIIAIMTYGLAIVVRKQTGEMVALMVVCYFMILLGVAIPYLGAVYGIARIYVHATILLSICFIMGSLDIARLAKIPVYLFLPLILIPFGLCTSGVMHGFFGFVR